MGLEEILAAVEEEAASSISSIEADAERSVRTATDEATERARTERNRISHRRDAAAGAARARIVNLAQLEADRAVRAAQEEVFSGILAQVVDRLSTLRSTDDYRSHFTRLTSECHQVLNDATVMSVDHRDSALAQEVIAELGLDLDVQADLDTWGGMDLSTDDGRFVRNTLETRLDKAMPVLRQVAVGIAPELGASM